MFFVTVLFSNATQVGEHWVLINPFGVERVLVRKKKQSTLDHVALYHLYKEMNVKRSKVSTAS